MNGLMDGWIDDVLKGPSQFSFEHVLAKLIITFNDNSVPGKKLNCKLFNGLPKWKINKLGKVLYFCHVQEPLIIWSTQRFVSLASACEGFSRLSLSLSGSRTSHCPPLFWRSVLVPPHFYPTFHFLIYSQVRTCTKTSRLALTPTHRLVKSKLGPTETPDHSLDKEPHSHL